MRAELAERLEFLADELVREEAQVLVPVDARLVMLLEDWSDQVQIRFIERDEPGLYDLEVRTVVEHGPPPRWEWDFEKDSLVGPDTDWNS